MAYWTNGQLAGMLVDKNCNFMLINNLSTKLYSNRKNARCLTQCIIYLNHPLTKLMLVCYHGKFAEI